MRYIYTLYYYIVFCANVRSVYTRTFDVAISGSKSWLVAGLPSFHRVTGGRTKMACGGNPNNCKKGKRKKSHLRMRGEAMIRCNVDGLVVFAMRQDPCSRIHSSIPAGSKGIRSSSAASSLLNRAF